LTLAPDGRLADDRLAGDREWHACTRRRDVLVGAVRAALDEDRRALDGIAERALLIGLRPVLVPSRRTDPPETVRFVDGRRVSVAGGRAAVERDGENYYFVIPLRNVGAGLAVLQSWHIAVLQPRPDTGHPKPEEFRAQTLDLYVPTGDTGFWQGAVREPDDPFREGLDEASVAGEMLTVDLLYGDHEGGQRIISRFILTREDDDQWRCGVVRHWALDQRGVAVT
jgi:hypothetical protein